VNAVRAVLFDAGFTLLRADPPVEEVYRESFARDGCGAARDALHLALGKTWSEIRDVTSPNRYGGATGERGFWEVFVRRTRFHLDGGAVSDACFSGLVEHFLQPGSWRVYPDVFPVLESLRGLGYPLAIVSNWDSTLAPLLEAHRLASHFDQILISASEKTAKPHPEIFHRACRRLELEPEEALHVGDSIEEDYDAAKSAGLSAVLLDRDGRHPEVPDRISSLEELPGIVAKMTNGHISRSLPTA
jgi:putative hydrolase of the HAD superfamily